MFCKVALTCLLCITAINARSIGNYNFPTHPTQNTNEFYPAAALPDYNPKSPVWQFRNELQAQYEKVEQLESQPYPYKLVNPVPKVEELTDFQELETQLAQEKQITQVADDVKSLQKTVSELEKYLKSAAAALPPQNKAYNETIRISKKLPKHGEVHGEDTNESDGGEIEKELKDVLKRVLVVLKTDGDIREVKKELENLISRMVEKELGILISRLFGEDSNESDSGEMKKELENLFRRMYVAAAEDGDIGEMKKELENLISRMLENEMKNLILFGEDSNESDSGEMENEWENRFSRMLEKELKNLILYEEDSNESDSGEMEKELDNLFSSILVGAVKVIGSILMN